MDTTTSPSSTTPAEAAVVASAQSAVPRDQSVVLYDVAWQQYIKMVDALGERRLRHTYSGGTLEMMTLSRLHEEGGELLNLLLCHMCVELDIDFLCLGSMTMRREDIDKGIEPDKCYYFANEPVVRDVGEIDFTKYPPPDLVMEFDHTSSSVPRLPLYAALGVPELWQVKQGQVVFLELVDGEYRSINTSKTFGFLPASKLTECLAMRNQKPQLKLVKEFIAWIRQQAS